MKKTNTPITHGIRLDTENYQPLDGLEWDYLGNRLKVLETGAKTHIIQCTNPKGNRIKVHVNNAILKRFGCPLLYNLMLLARPNKIASFVTNQTSSCNDNRLKNP